MNFTSFESLAYYLNNVPAINSGGCGFSAYFIYKYFKTHESELGKPEIVFLYDSDSWRYDHNNDALLGNCQPTSCYHVMVKFNENYYDSEGVHSTPNLDGYILEREHIVSEKFLLDALEDRSCWNSWFDRDEQLPKIEEATGIYLPIS